MGDPDLEVLEQNSRSAAWDQGRRNGIKWAVQWLHYRASTMSDPHARSLLNGAADGLGHAAKQAPSPTSERSA